jgi:hypothetical protein
MHSVIWRIRKDSIPILKATVGHFGDDHWKRLKLHLSMLKDECRQAS